MSFPFFPDLIFPALTDVTAEVLHRRGVRLLMLDFDNTIVPYTTSTPTDVMVHWLQQMRQSDISVCIVSNSKRDRVKIFCGQYGLDCITHAKKPFSRGIRQCLEKYGETPAHAALVGDQIYTDVLGANCMGLTSILVTAIHNHNLPLKARHVLELPFIAIRKAQLAKKDPLRNGKI